MQYNQNIKLTDVAIQAIISSDNERCNIIATELAKHINEIYSLLSSYHWDEKGIVHGIKINTDLVQINPGGKGHFVVNYGTNIHYGCSDKDIELNNKMTIAIEADLQNGQTTLTGEYIPEREPDGF